MDKANDVIAEIYAAGADVSRWNNIAKKLQVLFPGSGTAIVGFDYRSNVVLDMCVAGWPAALLKPYVEHYSNISPTFPRLRTLPVSTVFDSRELMSWNDLTRTEYYADFLRPLGFGKGAVVSLIRKEDRQMHMSIDIPATASEEASEHCRRTMQAVAPHMQQSFGLMRRLKTNGTAMNTISGILNLLQQPAILVDAFGRIIAANGKGEQELRAAFFFRGSGDVLQFNDAEAQTCLLQSLSALRMQKFEDLRLNLLINSGNGKRVASICPLAPQEYETGSLFKDFVERQAFAVVLLTGVDTSPIDAGLAKTLFGLTAAEGRLAIAIANGEELKNYALRNDISIHTARNQLKSIFANTGTQKQTQLALLLNRTSFPPAEFDG